MSYSVISLENITDLQNSRGPAGADTTIATILGPDYPLTEGYSVYAWDHASTAPCNPPEVVCPNLGTMGRWNRVDLSQIPQVNTDWNATTGVTSILNKPTLAPVALTGAYSSLTGTPNLSVYYLATNPSAYISGITGPQVLTALGFTPYNSTNPSGYISGITGAQIISALGFTPVTNARTLTINGLSQDLTANRTWTIPTPVTPTYNSGVTRTLNGVGYTISSTQPARVYYTISISCTASIGSASAGSVLMEYSLNGGTTWTPVGEIKNSNTVTLAIILNSVNLQQVVLAAEVPPGALCRLTPTTAGTTTITYIRGQEILY